MDTKGTKDTQAFRIRCIVLVSFLSIVPFASLVRAVFGAQQTFRTTTTLVEVDTIVTDGKGQFVPGLTADDFEVLEDGKPQKIERMYFVAGGTATAIPVQGEQREEFSGTPSITASALQRVFVLLFDQEHIEEAAFKRLREAAIAFLTTEFRHGDVGGIVLGNTMVGNQLTGDRELLLKAVRDAKPSFAKRSRKLEMFEWPRFNGESEAVRIAISDDREVTAQVVRRACQDDPAACTKADITPMILEKARVLVGELRPAARRTVMSLQALASGLARLPGRKTVILMTDGFFVEESWADLRQIVGAAARSNVRIYSLDTRGLNTRPGTDLHTIGPMNPAGGMPLDAYNSAEDGPNTLAIDTGGTTIRGTNKFAEALTEIARDASSFYVLGYSPVSASSDGSFHRIAVRVKRQGLKVRARRGYIAAPSPAAPTATVPAAPKAPVEPSTAAPEPTAATNTVAEPAAPVVPPAASTPPMPSSTAYNLRPDAGGRVRELASVDGGVERSTSDASKGWDRYQKGDLEGAAEHLEKAAVDPAARPWVLYALGYAHLGLRHLEKAAESWERVRHAVPEFRNVYLDLADAYLQMENYGHAMDVLKAADARWHGDVDVLNAMGTIQVRRGALDDAISSFKKATDAKPDDGLAYFNLGRTHAMRYFKMRRYSSNEGRWISNRADLVSAIESYEHYMKIGGPYVAQAREAVEGLRWMR